MKDRVVLRSIGIHDGAFHADEVAACALLVLFNLADKNLIRRTREEELLSSCEYVCDVGGKYDPEKKLFDHHQNEYQGHLSSAGMILLYLKDKNIIDEGLYDYLNRSLILGIDQEDNGKIPPLENLCTFSEVLNNFMPIEYTASFEEVNKAFRQVLDFTIWYLQKLQMRYSYFLKCRQIVQKSMNENKVVLLIEDSIPWMESFFALGGESHPALFVIMPTGKHWKLRGIPPTLKDKMKVRLPLPEKWAGLHEEELKKITNIPGAIFCHKGRFISVWQTKEDAMKALQYVLKRGKNDSF